MDEFVVKETKKKKDPHLAVHLTAASFRPRSGLAKNEVYSFVFFSFAVVWFGLFFLNVNAAKKALTFLHMSEEKGNAKRFVCYIAISD